MHVITHKRGLAEYFNQSGQFYYVLADLKGNYVYGNPLFLQRFHPLSQHFAGKNIESIFIDTDTGACRDAIRQCLQNPARSVPVGLHAPMPDDSLYFIKWEISAFFNEEGSIEYIQFIGADTDSILTGMHEPGNSGVRLPERYRAFEQSAEGLWMCESTNPVSVNDTPESIIEYWKKNSFLAECNHNMARMYGFEKAGELIGTSLEELMDFTDPARVEGLKIFIRNGFKTTSVETKEFDRHGNTKFFLNSMTGIVENGLLKRVWATQQDITKQRLAETQLQKSELFYRNLIKELIEQEIQKQRQLTQATIDGQEKERSEIGKELHDNINQHLTTTRLYLEVAKEKASGEVLEMIRLSHRTLAAIISEIRQLSQSLVPPTLGDLGLVESVYDLSDSLKRAHAFHIDFQHRHFNEEELAGNLKLMLFRIIQEQVNNIVRHANAKTIQIRLQSDAENIILRIVDDGKGFDTLNFRRGLGLSNISNRAGLFNGKVDIEAAPNQGCTLMVIIPLEEMANTVD